MTMPRVRCSSLLLPGLLLVPLLVALAPGAAGDEEATKARVAQLEAERAQLETEKATLAAQLQAAQERHLRDVQMLQRELAKANETLEAHRRRAVQILSTIEPLERELETAKRDAAQARAELTRAGPRASLQAVLGHVPVSWWAGQLGARDLRAREVALSVLEVRLSGTLAADDPLRPRVREALIELAQDEASASLADRATKLRKALAAETRD